MNYLVSLAVGTAINPSGSTRITGAEIAASKLGLRMFHETFDNYHEYMDNRVDGFKDFLTANRQGPGVYAHVLGNAGLYLHGGVTGNAGRAAQQFVDGVQAIYKGKESAAEIRGNAAGGRVGNRMWNYLSGNRTQADANKLTNDLTSELCK